MPRKKKSIKLHAIAGIKKHMNRVFRVCHGRLLAVEINNGIYAIVAIIGIREYTFIYGNYQSKRNNCQGVTKVGELRYGY